MPKRKFEEENSCDTSLGWSGVTRPHDLKQKFSRMIYAIPIEVFRLKNLDFSPKFDDLKILDETELCEHRIQQALTQWKQKKANGTKMSHIDFARSFKMPSVEDVESIWKKLRKRRKDRAEPKSRNEVNSWTHLRKRYRKQDILRSKEELSVKQHLLLLHVSIFNSIHSTQAGRLMKEMIFLDNHTLSDLAKQISCLADSKHEVKNSFFVVDGTIYCDREVDCAVFMEKQRRLYAENPKDPSMHPFQRKPMKNVDLCQLPIQLGKPFYFVHGGCQHQIVFTNVRISNKKIMKDSHNVREYPMPVYEQVKRRQKCVVCGDQTATKTTYNDIHATQSPCFWCENCYISFHYKMDGTKIYEEFEVEDYNHD